MAVTSANVVCGSEPWMLNTSSQLALVRRLEAAFPTLEDDDCKVGIGVATGADEIFIGAFDDLDVEPERKLPLVTTRDIKDGTVNWRGLGQSKGGRDSAWLMPQGRMRPPDSFLPPRPNTAAR